MKKFVSLAVIALGFVLLNGAQADVDVEKAKTLFKDNKCNTCHSVEAAGIAVVQEASADKEADEEGGSNTPPDLSAAGKERDAAWMDKYLNKKEKIKGKKHAKKFKGSSGDLEVITAWLASLKDADAAKKGNEKLKGKKK